MVLLEAKTPRFWHYKSVRLYLTLAFGLAVFGNAMIRNTLSMAMVCMVNSTTSSDNGQSTSVDNSTCSSSSDVQQYYHGTFNWGSFEQGLMFSALFVGGLLSTMPAGWLADRYDSKLLVTIGIFLSSLGCFFSPITANGGGYVGLIALRFVMGLFGQALIIPGISSISARWIPPTERSTVIALYTAGNQVASIIGTPMNAMLCASKFLGGWQAIFYVNGAFGVASCLIWMIVASNRPQSNRFITEMEKNYILISLENQNLGMKKIGFFGALPYISQWFGKIFFAVIADLLKKRTQLRPTFICKLFNTLAFIGAAIFLIACAYMNCSTSGLAIAFLTISNGLLSANVAGYQTSIISIAPSYSGTIMALSRAFGQFAAFLSPLFVAALTPRGSINEWKHVFIVISIIIFISSIVFIIYGSADIQEWAKVPNERISMPYIIDNGPVAITNDIKLEMHIVSKIN